MTRGSSTIESLHHVCTLLAKEPLTALQVAAQLGTIVRDEGGRLQIVVRPADGVFREAHVIRRADGDEPNSIDLWLTDPRALTVAKLRAALGDYVEPPPVHYDSPVEIAFTPQPTAGHITCTIIAQVEPGPSGTAGGTVPRVTVRRDHR